MSAWQSRMRICTAACAVLLAAGLGGCTPPYSPKQPFHPHVEEQAPPTTDSQQAAEAKAAREETAEAREQAQEHYDHAHPCNYEDLYQTEERLPNGRTNRFFGINGFRADDDICWRALAEGYYNEVPDTGTSVQHLYYICQDGPLASIRITSLKQLMATPALRRQVAMHYSSTMEQEVEERFPFR